MKIIFLVGISSFLCFIIKLPRLNKVSLSLFLTSLHYLSLLQQLHPITYLHLTLSFVPSLVRFHIFIFDCITFIHLCLGLALLLMLLALKLLNLFLTPFSLSNIQTCVILAFPFLAIYLLPPLLHNHGSLLCLCTSRLIPQL